LTKSKRVRLGLIGCGYVGQEHLRRFSALPHVEFRAVADSNRTRAERASFQVGGLAAVYTDPLKLVDEADVNAFLLCVPPFAHGEIERRVGKRGLPLLIEKPIARDVRTAQRCAKYFAPDQLVTVAYNWRYMPHVDKVRGLIARHPPAAFTAEWKEHIPGGKWWKWMERSGGPVIEQGSHLLDLGRYLLGPVTEVVARAGTYRKPVNGDVPDLFLASFRFASGALGQFTHTCLLNRMAHRIGYSVICSGIEIRGERNGRVEIISDAGREVLEDRDAKPEGGSSYEREAEAFLHAVRTGDRSRLRCSYGDAIESIRLAEAVCRAARTGRTVTLRPPRSDLGAHGALL